MSGGARNGRGGGLQIDRYVIRDRQNYVTIGYSTVAGDTTIFLFDSDPADSLIGLVINAHSNMNSLVP